MKKQEFFDLFAERLNMKSASGLSEQTELKSLDEWDSYGVLDIMAMGDEVFQVNLEANDFQEMKTIGDLMQKIGTSNFE